MIAWLVPAAVFKTVVPVLNRELGSIPRRSRHFEIPVSSRDFSIYEKENLFDPQRGFLFVINFPFRFTYELVA